MSRSADLPWRWVVAPLLVALLVGGLGARHLTPAVADDTAPVTAMLMPVVPLVRPVLDISFGDADLKSEARVEQLPRKTTVTLDSTVLFGKDSAKINSKAEGRLREVGAQLKTRGPGSVRVTGYTDDLGSAAHGRTLSRQRANAVAAVLRQDLPAASFTFSTVGKGEADPAAPNTSEKNRRTNRRVVVLYQKR
jgi:outer membrane protein OmpA-like peptidoglycan-associated protein